MRGIYIHIPFCKRKCYYCDFISFSNKCDSIGNYIEAVKKEIINTLKNDEEIDTIYIGGGTPSFIDSTYIKELLDTIYSKVGRDESREVTIEINPGTITEQKLLDYKRNGINRISIGLQTHNDILLKKIGRIHTYAEFLKAYDMVEKAGFKNINVDLMLGLPTQTIKDLEQTIENVSKLNPNHISVYSLILEEGTKLKELIDKSKLQLPNEEYEREMYWYVKSKLEELGYTHYEISNFAKKGYESKHNSNCWKQHEYYGFGIAAHSYIDNTRYSNTEVLEKYIQNINDNKFKNNITINEEQSEEDKMKEYMMLNLRTLEGPSIQSFKAKFSNNPLYIFRKEIEKLTNLSLLEVDCDNIRLTNKGLDFANEVWKEFI